MKVTIALREWEMTALKTLADYERRTVGDQAAVLIREGMRRIGVLRSVDTTTIHPAMHRDPSNWIPPVSDEDGWLEDEESDPYEDHSTGEICA